MTSSLAAIRGQDVLPRVAAFGLLGSILEWPSRPLPDAAFDDLLAQAASQRLVGLLAVAATEGDLPVTREQQDRLKSAWRNAMQACLMLEQAMVDTVEHLAAEGIEVRCLKGAAAAHLDYPDPSWRQSSDVDLLVRGDDIDRAIALLLREGYRRPVAEPRPGFDRRFGKGATLISPTGLELDLHRTFVMGPFGLALRLEDLWEASETVTVAGVELTALPAELRLVHACFHAVLGNRVPRLVPLRDIAQLVLGHKVDPDRLRHVTGRWGAEAVVTSAITAAWQTLGVADITGLSEWARRHEPSDRERHQMETYHRAGPHYAEMSWLSLQQLPLHQRLAFVWALAFPRAGELGGRRMGPVERLKRAARGWRSTVANGRGSESP